jgi:hypothetical protein
MVGMSALSQVMLEDSSRGQNASLVGRSRIFFAGSDSLGSETARMRVGLPIVASPLLPKVR